jgi:phenylacetate-CoA ligase
MLPKLYNFISGFRNPFLPRSRIEEIQTNRLRRLIVHAEATVPYYRDLFQREKVALGDLSDLSRIPITQKEALARLEMRARLSSQYVDKPLKSFRTGGTTGRPMEILCDQSAADLRAASLYRAYVSNGYRFTDRIATLMYRDPAANMLRKFGILNRSAIPFDLPLDKQVRLLQEIDANIIEGYPSRLTRVAHEVLRLGIQNIRPRVIFANSEKLTAGARATIKNAFEVEPVDVYESWEFGTVAWECPNHNGLHVNEDTLLVEVLKDGNPVGDGEQGEIVITDLFNQAMPFIRYATGDLAIRSRTGCGCGRTFKVLREVSGRVTDRLLLSDGTELTATVQLGELAATFRGIVEYQYVQDKKGELDVLVICNDLFSEVDEIAFKAKLLKAYQLERVTIKRVNQIARTIDRKLKPFVSNVVGQESAFS